MRAYTNASLLAYRGVLIERPCFWCDTTSIHMDNLCSDGPCAICGVRRHVNNWASHPATADGVWRGNYSEPLHDWAPHTYLPADIDRDLPAFEAMVDTARVLGMPEHYTSDLFRDYQFVAHDDKQPFVWIVRRSGTHIVTAHPNSLGGLKWLRDNEPDAHVFYWTGADLRPTNYDVAQQCLRVTGWVEAVRA
jgi:hypothetical protein